MRWNILNNADAIRIFVFPRDCSANLAGAGMDWRFNDYCLLNTGVFQTGYFKTDAEVEQVIPKEEGLEFRIFPNPSDGNTKLTMKSYEDGQLSVFNSWGAKVLQTKFVNGLNLLEVGGLNTGLYSYSAIYKGGEEFTGTFVITLK